MLQKYFDSNKITVQISNLPTSIQNDKTNFAKTEKCAKLLKGPTESSPGPTLPNVAATAVNAVAMLFPSAVSSRLAETNTKIYNKTKR